MGQPADPQAQIAIRDFPGLMDNADPHDLEPGAAERQVNACCIHPGELTVRHGFKLVTFDN